jgi:hypothetical protein
MQAVAIITVAREENQKPRKGFDGQRNNRSNSRISKNVLIVLNAACIRPARSATSAPKPWLTDAAQTP